MELQAQLLEAGDKSDMIELLKSKESEWRAQ